MGIIVEGKSKDPVYVCINNDSVEIKDASKLWGQTISATIEAVQAECGLDKSSLAAIGPLRKKN